MNLETFSKEDKTTQKRSILTVDKDHIRGTLLTKVPLIYYVLF